MIALIDIPNNCEECLLLDPYILHCKYFNTPLAMNINFKVIKCDKCLTLCKKSSLKGDENNNEGKN